MRQIKQKSNRILAWTLILCMMLTFPPAYTPVNGIGGDRYQPLTIASGFNADIIAEVPGDANGSTNNAFDSTGGSDNNALYSATYKSQGGLPDNRNVTSVSAPEEPTIPNTELTISQTSFTAVWNEVAGAVTYYLDVATDESFTNMVTDYDNRAVGNVTSHTVEGLEAGTTYYYRVRAATAVEQGLSSAPEAVTTESGGNAKAVLKTIPFWSDVDTVGVLNIFTVEEGVISGIPAITYSGTQPSSTGTAVINVGGGGFYRIDTFNAQRADYTITEVSYTLDAVPTQTEVSISGTTPAFKTSGIYNPQKSATPLAAGTRNPFMFIGTNNIGTTYNDYGWYLAVHNGAVNEQIPTGVSAWTSTKQLYDTEMTEVMFVLYNKNNTAVSDINISMDADVEIDEDDNAAIEPIKISDNIYGFYMDSNTGKRFALVNANSGKYGDETAPNWWGEWDSTYYTPNFNSNSESNTRYDQDDSAVVAKVRGISLEPGEVRTYSFFLGAGTAADIESAIDDAIRETGGDAIPESKPSADVDYTAEKLTGLTPNAVYEIDGTEYTADENGKIDIDNTWFGTEISIIKKGNGINTIDSGAQEIPIAPRPDAPSPIGGVEEITNVDDTMEYRESGTTIWIPINGTAVTALDSGAYEVRIKPTSIAPGSYIKTVMVTDNEDTYDINGNVKYENGDDVDGAILSLLSGNAKMTDATSDSDGAFNFPDVPDGIYNVVVTDGETIVTQLVTIDGGNVDGLVLIIPNGKKNSRIEIKDDTPNVLVGNLDGQFVESDAYTTSDAEVVAGGGMVELKFIAEQRNETSVADDAVKINDIIDAESNLGISMYLDFTVEKTVVDEHGTLEYTDTVAILPEPLKIIIPLPNELQGLSGYRIFRVHNGIAEALPSYGTGERFEVNKNADGKAISITLYVNRFSTYAIATSNCDIVRVASGGILDEENNTITETVSNGISSRIIDIVVGKGAVWKLYSDEGCTQEIDNKTMALLVGENKAWIKVTANGTEKIYAVVITRRTASRSGGRTSYSTEEEEEISPVEPTEEYNELPFVKGYSEGIFRPEHSITRAEIAQILYNLFGNNEAANQSVLNQFADLRALVGGELNWAKGALSWATENGYLKGYGDGTAKPNQSISRAELAEILYRTAQNEELLGEIGAAAVTVSDIGSHWAEESILQLIRRGVAKGYEDDTFRPDNDITRAEAVTMVSRLLGRTDKFTPGIAFSDVPQSHWAYAVIMNATNGNS